MNPRRMIDILYFLFPLYNSHEDFFHVTMSFLILSELLVGTIKFGQTIMKEVLDRFA